MLSLRDLLRELDVRVVAGEAGLDRAVRWVHISELADPTPWLSGGELLLTTGLQLGDDAQQREYVARLSAHGLSGLGFGVGFSHEQRARSARAGRRRARLPAVRGPYDLPFIAITEKAFTHLVNEHYAVLQRALSAHERLERIVLSERGLDGVASALSAMIGGAALIFDARGEVLARAPAAPGYRPALNTLVTGAARAPRAGRAARLRPRHSPPARALALPVARTGGRRPVPRARCPRHG